MILFLISSQIQKLWSLHTFWGQCPERDHEKVIDFRRISCRACAAHEGFHGIRLQSEKFISLILFTAPAPEGDFPPIGERNGGALPYDPLFTLLLCDVLRTIWFPARHSAECTSANPRGLCVAKRGQDHPHLLLRCTTCHPHRHDMGHWGDEKRGIHPPPCLGRNKPGGRYYHHTCGIRCLVPRLPSHHHSDVVFSLQRTQAD